METGPSQTTQRHIPRWLAAVVADFEMSERSVVTLEDVAEALGRAASASTVRKAIHDLVELGWLRPLPSRGTYEFLVARGGPWSTGDPLVEVKGQLARRPDFRLAVIGTGAAFLRGLAERPPTRYSIAIDKAQGGSVALSSTYHVVRTTTRRLAGVPSLDGIPVSDAPRLLLDSALWPASVGDLRAADHWLSRALPNTDPDAAGRVAAMAGPATAARMAYIAAAFGADEVRNRIRLVVPARAHTAIGDARAPLWRRDPALGVEDHLGVASLR